MCEPVKQAKFYEYDVVAIGHSLLDIEYKISSDFLAQHGIRKGLHTLVDAQRQRTVIQAINTEKPDAVEPGGSAANTLFTLAQLGARGYFFGHVADDQFGRQYHEAMQRVGLDNNLGSNLISGAKKSEITDKVGKAGTTGTCLALVTPDADRTFNSCLGISEQLSPPIILR